MELFFLYFFSPLGKQKENAHLDKMESLKMNVVSSFKNSQSIREHQMKNGHGHVIANVKRKYNVVLCAAFRQETKHIVEWLEYYIIMGVSAVNNFCFFFLPSISFLFHWKE